MVTVMIKADLFFIIYVMPLSMGWHWSIVRHIENRINYFRFQNVKFYYDATWVQNAWAWSSMHMLGTMLTSIFNSTTSYKLHAVHPGVEYLTWTKRVIYLFKLSPTFSAHLYMHCFLWQEGCNNAHWGLHICDKGHLHTSCHGVSDGKFQDNVFLQTQCEAATSH